MESARDIQSSSDERRFLQRTRDADSDVELVVRMYVVSYQHWRRRKLIASWIRHSISSACNWNHLRNPRPSHAPPRRVNAPVPPSPFSERHMHIECRLPYAGG